jgi:hypothetical protein
MMPASVPGPESARNILSRGTQRRITKTLLIVSTVTVVLNLPRYGTMNKISYWQM